MKKFLFVSIMLLSVSIGMNAQRCTVQGVIRYFYNDYIGFQPDNGTEIHFIKYSSTHKIPDRKKWDNYQDLVDKWIMFKKYRQHLNLNESLELSEYKEEYEDSIQTLGTLLLLETIDFEDKNLIKYSTIVDNSGKYSISVPYGIYYVWIKSKNRKLATLLEYKNRQRMIRVNLKSPTKVISYDFDILR